MSSRCSVHIRTGKYVEISGMMLSYVTDVMEKVARLMKQGEVKYTLTTT